MTAYRNRPHRTPWLALAALCLLLISAAAPASAAPAADGAPEAPLGWALDWWQELQSAWSLAVAGAGLPDADPNGFVPAPIGEGGEASSEVNGGEGDGLPNADPDG